MEHYDPKFKSGEQHNSSPFKHFHSFITMERWTLSCKIFVSNLWGYVLCILQCAAEKGNLDPWVSIGHCRAYPLSSPTLARQTECFFPSIAHHI